MDSLVSVRKGLRIVHDADETLRHNGGLGNSSRGVGNRAAACKGMGDRISSSYPTYQHETRVASGSKLTPNGMSYCVLRRFWKSPVSSLWGNQLAANAHLGRPFERTGSGPGPHRRLARTLLLD